MPPSAFTSGTEVTPQQQAEILGRAFEQLIVSQTDIAAFSRANDLARQLHGHDLSEEQRIECSQALDDTMKAIDRVLPKETQFPFFQAFQAYHDLTRFRAGEKAPTVYYEENPDAAQPGRANFIAAALNPPPKGPGVAVDFSEVPQMLERAERSQKLPTGFISALKKANDAAVILAGDDFYSAKGLADGMRLTGDMLKSKGQDFEPMYAFAEHLEGVAARDREQRPLQSLAMDEALATLEASMPGNKGKKFTQGLLDHYNIARRDYFVENGTTMYVSINELGKKRQPGAYLPLSIAKEDRAASR